MPPTATTLRLEFTSGLPADLETVRCRLLFQDGARGVFTSKRVNADKGVF